MSKFKEAILNQPIASLSMSEEFCGVTEILGMYTLSDLLRHHTRDLARMPGISIHLIHEYITFLEANDLGKYVDPI